MNLNKYKKLFIIYLIILVYLAKGQPENTPYQIGFDYTIIEHPNLIEKALFGLSVLALDYNADGLEDIVVSAPGENKVYLFYGPDWQDYQTFQSNNVQTREEFGFDIAIGNIDNIPGDEIIVGSPKRLVDGFDRAGAIYIFGHNITNEILITGSNVSGERGLGNSLTIGDYDNDGKLDIVSGSPGMKQDGISTGAVDIFFIKDLENITQRTIYNHQTTEGANYGHFLATSDWNGDGIDDLFISALANENTDGLASAGQIVLLEGPIDINNVAEIVPIIFQDNQPDETDLPGPRWGMSIAARSNYLLVGSPRKDVEGTEDAGMGFVFQNCEDVKIVNFNDSIQNNGLLGYRCGVADVIGDAHLDQIFVSLGQGIIYVLDGNEPSKVGYVPKLNNGFQPRDIAWTHFYSEKKETLIIADDRYSKIDGNDTTKDVGRIYILKLSEDSNNDSIYAIDIKDDFAAITGVNSVVDFKEITYAVKSGLTGDSAVFIIEVYDSFPANSENFSINFFIDSDLNPDNGIALSQVYDTTDLIINNTALTFDTIFASIDVFGGGFVGVGIKEVTFFGGGGISIGGVPDGSGRLDKQNDSIWTLYFPLNPLDNIDHDGKFNFVASALGDGFHLTDYLINEGYLYFNKEELSITEFLNSIINLNSEIPTSACAADNFNITYSISTSFNECATNYVELSNKDGLFNEQNTIIGYNQPISSTTNTIVCNIPLNISYSKDYKIRIVVNDPSIIYELPNSIEIGILEINLGADDSICIDSNLIIDAGTDYNEYQWNTGSMEQLITVNEPGTYFVTVGNSIGCEDSDTIIFYEKDCSKLIENAIQEKYIYEMINIFPSITSDFINIEFKELIHDNPNVHINIFDVIGNKLVSKDKVIWKNYILKMDIAQLAVGQYIIEVGTENTSNIKAILFSKY